MNSWTPVILIFIALVAGVLFSLKFLAPSLHSATADLLEKYYSSKFSSSVALIIGLWFVLSLFWNFLFTFGLINNVMLLIGSPMLFRWLVARDLKPTI